MEKIVKRIIAVLVSIMLLSPAFAGVTSISMTAEAVVSPLVSYDPEAEFVPGEIMIMLKEPYLEADLAELLPEIEIVGYEDLYASVIEVIGEKNVSEELLDEVGTMFTVSLADDTRDGVINAIDKLCENETILSASPNYLSESCSTVPNDTHYNYQWALPKISAPEAWDTITDSSVRIAVLDTGICDSHADLDDNINMSLAYNAFTHTLGDVEDTEGHGTHVAGIIAAEGNNSQCVCGVVWNAEIVPIKIAGPDQDHTSCAAEVRAIIYASAIGTRVANLSYKLKFSYPLLHALTGFSNNGGIIVVAAGNAPINGSPTNNDGNSDNWMYSAIDGVVFVGASYQTDAPAWFSNYGANTVDIFAPGVGIYSTIPIVENNNLPFEWKQGTSMAAPLVTGAFALLMSEYPYLSALTIKNAIIDNADYVAALDGMCVANGRLNIKAALDALANVTEPPVGSGYPITISSNVINGTIIPSSTYAQANTFVTLTANPNTGYWLKPDTLSYNGIIIDQEEFDGYVYNPIANEYVFDEYGEQPETDFDGFLYINCAYFKMPATSVTITAEFYMIGDVDNDRSITVSDVLAVLRHVAGLDELSGDAFIRADVDGDGDVDNDDAQYIGDYAVGNITVFPIET